MSIGGKPMFKIMTDPAQASVFFANSMIRWVALLLLVLASMMFLWSHRSIRNFILTTATLAGMTILLYFLAFSYT